LITARARFMFAAGKQEIAMGALNR